MSAEEKREYNQRRTESFRKRRVEEEILLSTPAGRISAEALQKVCGATEAVRESADPSFCFPRSMLLLSGTADYDQKRPES